MCVKCFWQGGTYLFSISWCLWLARRRSSLKLLLGECRGEWLMRVVSRWAAAVAAASMANWRMVHSSRYFCSHLVMSASSARIFSSLSLSCSDSVWALSSGVPPLAVPACLCSGQNKAPVRMRRRREEAAPPCPAGATAAASTHLLSPQHLQLLLQAGAEPQLQLLPLLAGGLELPQGCLQPLHLLHVGSFLPELGLCLGRPRLGAAQRLLQQLCPPPLVLVGAAQQGHLPLQLLLLLLVLIVCKGTPQISDVWLPQGWPVKPSGDFLLPVIWPCHPFLQLFYRMGVRAIPATRADGQKPPRATFQPKFLLGKGETCLA